MELLRFKHDNDLQTYLQKTSHIFESLSDRGLMGLSEIIESGIITEENNALVFLYRHLISLIDSLPAITKTPSVESLQIIMRSIFEASCYLLYMVEQNMDKRSAAYQVYYIRQRIKLYKRFDLDTDLGKTYKDNWSKDRVYQNIPIISLDTKKDIINLQSQLNRSPYKEINDEYAKIKKSTKGRFNWYTYDSNCTNFKDLCFYLNRPISYDVFFKMWSTSTHSTGAYSGKIIKKDSGAGIDAIRSLSGHKDLILISISFIEIFYRDFFKELLPDFFERHLRYYKNQLRPLEKEIQKNKNYYKLKRLFKLL